MVKIEYMQSKQKYIVLFNILLHFYSFVHYLNLRVSRKTLGLFICPCWKNQCIKLFVSCSPIACSKNFYCNLKSYMKRFIRLVKAMTSYHIQCGNGCASDTKTNYEASPGFSESLLTFLKSSANCDVPSPAPRTRTIYCSFDSSPSTRRIPVNDLHF